jgi:hypothetical protein
MSNEALVFRSLDSLSHAPAKSQVRRWFDKLLQGTSTSTGHSKAMAVAHVAARGVRQVGEGAITGAALGAAKALLKDGLDPKVGNVTVPLDLAVGVAGVGTAMLMAGEEGSHDALNIGTAGATIFAFRQTEKLVAAKHAQMHGDSFAGSNDGDMGAEDPIVRLARQL